MILRIKLYNYKIIMILRLTLYNYKIKLNVFRNYNIIFEYIYFIDDLLVITIF